MGERTDARARRGTLVGQVVDGHELLRVLAAGGMGEVYLARHLRLGVHRAIKVIRDNQRESSHATERFQHEAQVLSRLQHNSIVQIIEYGELPNGWPFLAMEYVDGPNLDQVIEAGGPMALGPALEVLAQIAEALDYAHRQNVIHRDLKPANVLLRAGDVRQVKVIDFGLARTVSAGALSRLTAEGQMIGSPLYMAPEQADGQLEVTGAVDAYALAGVAYTLLSGKPPFADLPLLRLIAAHATEEPERLSARCPWLQLPRLLDQLLFASLAKEPEARPHIDELASHLSRLARAAADEPGPAAREALAATMASAATAPPRRRGVGNTSELARLIEAPPRDDGSGMAPALVNQMMAVVGDLAAALSSRDAELGDLLGELETANAALTDLEMDVAVLDSRLEDAPPAELAALRAEHAAALSRVGEVKGRVTQAQRRIVVRIESMRGLADEVARTLFAEVDEVMQRLRGLSGVGR
jgi:serine/threonine-protein kinase